MKINYIHTEEIHNTNAATEVLPYLFKIIRPNSVVDFGCGTGSWLKVCAQLGAKKIMGVDGIHVDKAMLHINEDEFLQNNLTLPLTTEDKYDLAICLEVVEHLPETSADTIVNTLTGCSDVILFSAGIPGQGGQFHINEQWPDYWQEKFKKLGFLPVDNLRNIFWNNPMVDWWYKQNMFLYVKEEVLNRLGLQPSAYLPVYIHPELLHLKLRVIEDGEQHIGYLEKIIEKEVNKPSFLPSLKKLIKSIVR